jgi:hypothetical protein
VAAGTLYGQTMTGQYSATAARRIDWVTDTIRMTLHTATYTPNRDTHVFASDLTNEVAAGGGYSTGGVTLGTKSVSYDSTAHLTRLIAADPSWGPGATITCRYAVIWKDTGTSTTSPLMGYIDLGAQSITSGTLTVDLDQTNGVFTFG